MAANPKPGGPSSGEYEYFSAGGDWGDAPSNLANDKVFLVGYRNRFDFLGFRCARDK